MLYIKSLWKNRLKYRKLDYQYWALPQQADAPRRTARVYIPRMYVWNVGECLSVCRSECAVGNVECVEWRDECEENGDECEEWRVGCELLLTTRKFGRRVLSSSPTPPSRKPVHVSFNQLHTVDIWILEHRLNRYKA